MNPFASQAQRNELVNKVRFTNPSQKSDLLNANLTEPNLILALLHEVHKGRRILITSVRSDHDDDSGLGPHGHARGFSADIWPENEAVLPAFLQDMCSDNPWVTRVGRGGAAQRCAVNPHDIIMFDDNLTDHIHLQTGG